MSFGLNGTIWARGSDFSGKSGAAAPVIENQTFYVADGSIAGNAFVQPFATGESITWSITAGNTGTDWQIDSGTGYIDNLNTLDAGTTAQYNLTVQVDNGAQDTATITINVVEVSTNLISLNKRRGRRF